MRNLPSLVSLRAFEAAGRLLSIRQAAAELHVTPAAVSRQVRCLEAYVGVRLFTRDHRAIKLTPAGEQYFSDIAGHFSGMRRATEKLFAARGRKLLRIRAYTTFAMRWLIPRLSSFHSMYPNIDVRLTTSLDWVDFEREDVDAAIRLGGGAWPGVRAYRLVRNELTPVCSPNLVRKSVEWTLPDVLAHKTLLHSLARPDDWASWLAAVGAKSVDAYSGLKYESSVLAYQAAIEGQGVAIAQLVLVQEDVAAGRLVKPFDFCLDMRGFTYYLICPLTEAESVELTLFRDWLQAQTEQA